MSISTNLTEDIRKSQLKKIEKKQFDLSKSGVVIPFGVSGIQNYTNSGYTPYEINPNDSETFKRIWTGNDSCCIIGENSVKITTNNNNNEINLKYQLGEYKLGILIDNNSSTQVNKDSSYTLYTSEEIKTTLTLTFPALNQKFDDYDLLKFYKIPRLTKEMIFRIVSIHKNFDVFTKEVDYYTVTFESVNQTFASTGKARQQNINISSVGQGYLNPIVGNKNEFDLYNQNLNLKLGIDYIQLLNNEYLTADKEKIKHRPAKKAIIKLYGNAAPISISFVGRPVFYNDPPEKLRALRLLFPITLEQPITPNLQRTSNSTNNGYFGEFAPSLEFGRDFSSSLKDYVNNVVVKQKFDGVFAYDKEKTFNTNIKTSSGNYAFSLYNFPDEEVNLLGTPGLQEELISLPYTYGVFEKENSFHKFGVQKNILDILFDNYGIYKNDLYIPLNTHETVTYGSFITGGISSIAGGIGSALKPAKNGLNIFSLLGVGAALLGIGLANVFSRNNISLNSKKIACLVSAPYLELSSLQFDTSHTGGESYIPITSFNNTDIDVVNTLLFNSSNSFNFQAQMELTDLFENLKPDITNKINPAGIYSTTSIGQQDKFENQNGNLVTETGWKILMDGQQTLKPHKNIAGYIIEQINIDSCFAGDISIEFLDVNDQVIFSGIYQSEAKGTGNIRDRRTTINTSVFNNQNIFVNKPFNYPQNIINPTIDKWLPTIMISKSFYVSINYKFGYETTTQHLKRKRTNIDVTKINQIENNLKIFEDNKWVSWNIILNNYRQIKIDCLFEEQIFSYYYNISDFKLVGNRYIQEVNIKNNLNINSTASGEVAYFFINGSTNGMEFPDPPVNKTINMIYGIIKIVGNLVFDPISTSFTFELTNLLENNDFINWNNSFRDGYIDYNRLNYYFRVNQKISKEYIEQGIKSFTLFPK